MRTKVQAWGTIMNLMKTVSHHHRFYTIYEKDFSMFHRRKKRDGKVYHFIELTPHDKTKPYFKIRLGIDNCAKDRFKNALVFDQEWQSLTYEK